MNGRKRFFIQRDVFWEGYDFFMVHEMHLDGHWQKAYPEPVVMKLPKLEDEGKHRPPMLQLSQEDCQQLMDELWRAGFRPAEGTGSAGALAAVEKHLQDMRAIVMSELQVKL